MTLQKNYKRARKYFNMYFLTKLVFFLHLNLLLKMLNHLTGR